MIELFADIPVLAKQLLSNYIDEIFSNYELQECAHHIADLANNCEDKKLQDFIDFYFKLKLEQIKNESNND